jgi:hypothetical protein
MSKCGPIGSYGQSQALRAHVWATMARNATVFGSKRPEQEILCETLNTPRLTPNCPLFAHLGAPLGHAKAWSYRFLWPKPGTIVPIYYIKLHYIHPTFAQVDGIAVCKI